MHGFSKPNLLSTESATEFTALRSELENHIQPTDVIEGAFVDDLVELIWEILRLRRIRIGVIRNAFPAALESIYKQVFHEQDFMKILAVEAEAAQMASDYFHDAKSKQKFLEVLGRFGLEEDAIEAEAFRLAGVDLERIDKMLSAAARRRDKLLRFIGRYRESLATQIRQVIDRIIAEAEKPHPEPSTDGADCGE